MKRETTLNLKQHLSWTEGNKKQIDSVKLVQDSTNLIKKMHLNRVDRKYLYLCVECKSRFAHIYSILRKGLIVKLLCIVIFTNPLLQ